MKTIDNDIKTGQFKQIYLLYGEEQYLIRQYRDKLKHALAADDDTMNFSAFSGSDINQKEIIDLAETLPFFADRRLILIEDSGLFKKSAEELADYMSSIPETTYFVFAEKEIDKKTKMYKQVKKNGNIVEFPRQKKADGFTAEVEKQIDRLIGKVSAKMEEIEVSMKEDVADGKRLNEEKAKELKDSLAQIEEQLTTAKTEISEKVHTENVKCYRNISDLFRSMDERLDKQVKKYGPDAFCFP